MFDCENSSEMFLSKLQSMSPNLRFTMGIMQANQLSDLDVHISMQNGDMELSVFRKPTHTGVLLNYKSQASKIWKTNK